MSDMEALSDYVGAEDGALQWTLQNTSAHAYATVYEFALTSQIWQGRAWTHRLQLFRPHSVTATGVDAVLLYITTQGGRAETELGLQAAMATGIACAFLYDVPNQPLFDGLLEDALIAHTLVRYLETGDATWPLLFPMVKSVTRAMDALQQFSRQAASGSSDAGAVQQTAAGQAADGQHANAPHALLTPFTRFLITGASKRGWTSWLTAVAEAQSGRVSAILPMVYDNLNLSAQMPHQREVTGGYSASIHDYTELDLQARMATPEGARLAQMIDPYTYRDRLALPKLIINGANDSYWMTDALNLYWSDLPDPKHVLYVPNTGHFLNDPSRVYATLVAFVRATVAGDALPAPILNVTDTENFVSVSAGNLTEDVRLWIAHSETRDFRAARWNSPTPMPRDKGQEWMTSLRKPAEGFMAVFGEFGFVYDGLPYTLSTPIHIFAPAA